MSEAAPERIRLQKFAQKFSVLQYLDCKRYVQDIYDAIKRKNPTYSYIRFSQDLGLGNANMSLLILRGHRPLTEASAAKMALAFGFRGVRREYFICLAKATYERQPEQREVLLQRLGELRSRRLSTESERKQLDFFSSWHHAIILEMTKLPSCPHGAAKIAERLAFRLAPSRVRKSLALLEELGFVVSEGADGPYRASETAMKTSADVREIGSLRFHQQMLELAKEAVLTLPPEERDLSALTLSVTDEVLEQMKEEARAFQQKLIALAMGCPRGDRVVQANVQIFPATKSTRSDQGESLE